MITYHEGKRLDYAKTDSCDCLTCRSQIKAETRQKCYEDIKDAGCVGLAGDNEEFVNLFCRQWQELKKKWGIVK